MADLNLTVQTADRSRKADVTVPDTQTFGDILEAATENWALETGGIDYKIAVGSSTPPKIFSHETTLAEAGVKQEEILTILCDVPGAQHE